MDEEAKVKAVSRLQLVEEKQRDQVGQQLEAMRRRQAHMQQQVAQLAQLKTDSVQSAFSAPALNSSALMNLSQVDLMLQKLLLHHEEEQALMQAQCQSVQKQLEHKHARVMGLEKVLERWRAQQRYKQARKEQKQLEDLINARLKKRLL